jgi:hypothetical protein
MLYSEVKENAGTGSSMLLHASIVKGMAVGFSRSCCHGHGSLELVIHSRASP